jgi:glutamyl-tRNA(Gln) amidotransferase subunit E
LLNWETQTDTYFSKEISDRVRVIACLTVLPNILHSDNSREKLTNTEWTKLKKFANATNNDTIVLVWGDDRDVVTGAKEVIIRAKEATIGIPSETRQALDDSTNGFERILPGPERMYPDTDLPPLTITKERLDRIRAQMPVPYWISEKWLKQLNVQADLVSELSVSKSFGLFEKAVKEYRISPKVAANILIGFPRRLKKSRLKRTALNEAVYLQIFDLLNNKSLVKDGIYSLMSKICTQGNFDNTMLPKIADNIEINRTIVECINDMSKIKIINQDKSDEVLMGLVMNKLRGRVNGSDILNFINNRKQEA